MTNTNELIAHHDGERLVIIIDVNDPYRKIYELALQFIATVQDALQGAAKEAARILGCEPEDILRAYRERHGRYIDKVLGDDGTLTYDNLLSRMEQARIESEYESLTRCAPMPTRSPARFDIHKCQWQQQRERAAKMFRRARAGGSRRFRRS